MAFEMRSEPLNYQSGFGQPRRPMPPQAQPQPMPVPPQRPVGPAGGQGQGMGPEAFVAPNANPQAAFNREGQASDQARFNREAGPMPPGVSAMAGGGDDQAMREGARKWVAQAMVQNPQMFAELLRRRGLVPGGASGAPGAPVSPDLHQGGGGQPPMNIAPLPPSPGVPYGGDMVASPMPVPGGQPYGPDMVARQVGDLYAGLGGLGGTSVSPQYPQPYNPYQFAPDLRSLALPFGGF